MSKTERYLEIVTVSENSSYYINFNDVDVFTEASDAPVRHTIPVNHWAINGDNKIFVSVNFRENKPLDLARSSKLNLAVYLRVKSNGQETSHLITQFNLAPSSEHPDKLASSSIENIAMDSTSYNKSESGDITVGAWKATQEESWIDFEQNIKIDLNLPKWSYLSADFLGSIDSMEEEQFFSLSDNLFEEYKKLWNVMKSKDLDKLLELTALRSREMNQAFHLKAGSKEADMKKSLSTAFSNPDLYLDEIIDNESAQLSILANGRVVNIKVAGTTEPPIYFSHTRESFTRMYDFYFMKKDGKWIIIR